MLPMLGVMSDALGLKVTLLSLLDLSAAFDRVERVTCDLGVVIESCLTTADHVSAICRSGYFQLRQLRPVARSLTADAAKTIVRAFVACRLDYCNSLLHGITDSLFRRLQSIQNAAACLVTGTRRRDHITPVLRDLHWLPVRRRVDYTS